MRPCRVVVMAKAPVPGFAKTRLMPALGAEGAARLAGRLLDHALQAARTAQLGPVTLACAPDITHPAFVAQAASGGVLLVPQGEGDLGARMQAQFSREFEHGAGRVLLMGTDAPALGSTTLQRAAQALDTSDAVFVPAVDGGYALVGLRRLLPALFDAMPWSTSEVMARTRERLALGGVRHAELPAVHDIDEPADLLHLPPDWLSSFSPAHDQGA
jgi:uncharacterized protein